MASAYRLGIVMVKISRLLIAIPLRVFEKFGVTLTIHESIVNELCGSTYVGQV
jgi:hypothetical protein